MKTDSKNNRNNIIFIKITNMSYFLHNYKDYTKYTITSS